MKSIISKSPLLQACINSMRKEKGPQPANEPIQVHIYNQGQPAAADVPLAVPQSNALIPATHVAGLRLDIKDFVNFYQLPSSFLRLFVDNAIFLLLVVMLSLILQLMISKPWDSNLGRSLIWKKLSYYGPTKSKKIVLCLSLFRVYFTSYHCLSHYCCY